MKQIENIEDIKILVNSFYERVREDDLLGDIFNTIIQDNWPKHLEKMYRFWESNIFDSDSYQGNPMLQHIKLHKRQAMSTEMFNLWLAYWQQTVTELFVGEKAEKALFRAATIKDLMQQRVLTDELPHFMQHIRSNINQ